MLGTFQFSEQNQNCQFLKWPDYQQQRIAFNWKISLYKSPRIYRAQK